MICPACCHAADTKMPHNECSGHCDCHHANLCDIPHPNKKRIRILCNRPQKHPGDHLHRSTSAKGTTSYTWKAT